MSILKAGGNGPEHKQGGTSGNTALMRRRPVKIVHLVLLCALVLALVLVLAAGEGLTSAHAAHVTRYGQDVRIIDGDTLQVDGNTVHLYGIDAPELDSLCKDGERSWHCGRDAALKLEKLITLSGGPLLCSPWPPDGGSGGQAAARVCKTEGEDLGLVLVRDGYAVTLAESFPEYEDAQAYARQARLGLWRDNSVLR